MVVGLNGLLLESGDNNGSSHEVGDTPQEKRVRVGSPAVEAKGKDKLSKSVDIKESGKPDDTRLLDLSASERIFNIGKSTRDESKPDSLRMLRTGLQKEGSRLVFGVPKPGKKRVYGRSGPRGTKGKIEPKEKRMAVSKPKMYPPKKASTSNARSKRNNKGKLAPAAGRLTKVEEEKVFNGNSSKTTP
ncbi:hypothetical protein COLO4_17037 [Corchorus olitorius]|uniref:Uncharacterized protein n=1 Tax=Corchorus olitorius TaxID=93759 RepID=A0A1R3JEJ2_9ROSI|nr:hypothetical protein COLO4_17037 [Corchorus olitorius]